MALGVFHYRYTRSQSFFLKEPQFTNKKGSMLHLEEVKSTIAPGVRLVAVSKFHPAALIQEAYDEGQRIFGESRVQELEEKRKTLPTDIEWHFIGHLQVNKVKYIVPYVSLIHTVDSLKLLREIEKQAAKHNRVVRCLLELHIAQEETKTGLTPAACTALLEDGEWRTMEHVQLCGIMCMASNTDNMEQVRNEFHTALEYFHETKERFFPNDSSFCERSWGMSHDYPLAMQEGATLVRIGTAIFGEREY